MFNVGGGEVLMIMVIALVILGPAKLPDAARRVGNVMGELRRMSSGFQAELRSAMNEPDTPAATPSSPAVEVPAPAPLPAAAPARATTRHRRSQPLRAAPRAKRPAS